VATVTPKPKANTAAALASVAANRRAIIDVLIKIENPLV
jgi:hypothetical protein